jgi:hypothetical protein
VPKLQHAYRDSDEQHQFGGCELEVMTRDDDQRSGDHERYVQGDEEPRAAAGRP